jgi:hypothetical protein
VPALVACTVLDHSDTNNGTRAYFGGDNLVMRESDVSGADRQRRQQFVYVHARAWGRPQPSCRRDCDARTTWGWCAT